MKQKRFYSFADLIEIMKRLRGENGCPWDREQTHQSIRKNMIEEAYEVCEAIDLQDPVLLQEELGDVLMQVVFHSLMEEEAGTFCLNDVINGVCQKLILRHPHVFGNVEVSTADQVLDNWDAIKRKSKGQKTCAETLHAVPTVLPALMRAQKILGRASKAEIAKELLEETSARKDLSSVWNLEEPTESAEEAIGDLLLRTVDLARRQKIDSEEALTRASERFIAKLEALEKESTGK